MKATGFEERHANLLHQLLVGAAFLTYVFERDDVVWRFIKDSPKNKMLEHALFAFATFLVGLAALICTRTHVAVTDNVASSSRTGFRYLGDFLYALGLAWLVPLAGFVILVLGEAIRISRLKGRGNEVSCIGVAAYRETAQPKTRWLGAVRGEAIKWGIFVAMVAFTFTLNDRVADILIVLGWIVGLVLVKTRSAALRSANASFREP